jgi:cbb3-type cytochrome oxidase maturation protein
MSCDCALGRAGFLPGYWLPLFLALLFAVGAVTVIIWNIKSGQYDDIEAAKYPLMDLEE